MGVHLACSEIIVCTDFIHQNCPFSPLTCAYLTWRLKKLIFIRIVHFFTWPLHTRRDDYKSPQRNPTKERFCLRKCELGCFKKDTLKKNETSTPARNWGIPKKFISWRKCWSYKSRGLAKWLKVWQNRRRRREDGSSSLHRPQSASGTLRSLKVTAKTPGAKPWKLPLWEKGGREMRKRSLLKVVTLLAMRGFNWKEVESVFLSE